MDYLYSFFLDEPAYNEAIKTALPSDEDRKAGERDLRKNEKQLRVVNHQIENLVKAVAQGADPALMVNEQDRLKAEKQTLELRRDDLQDTLANMPDPVAAEQEAQAWRTYLKWEIQNRDWRSIPYEVLQQYLHFLFGKNPRKDGYGIFVSKRNDQWQVTFKGRFEPAHALVDGQRIPVELLRLQQLQQKLEGIRKRLKSPRRIKQLERSYAQVKSKLLELTTISEERQRIGRSLASVEGWQSCVVLNELKVERLNKKIADIERRMASDLRPESGNELPILPTSQYY